MSNEDKRADPQPRQLAVLRDLGIGLGTFACLLTLIILASWAIGFETVLGFLFTLRRG